MVCPIWCQSLGSQFHSSGKQGRWYPVRVSERCAEPSLATFTFLSASTYYLATTQSVSPHVLSFPCSWVLIGHKSMLRHPQCFWSSGCPSGSKYRHQSHPTISSTCSVQFGKSSRSGFLDQTSNGKEQVSGFLDQTMTKSKLHLEPLGFLEGEKRTTLFCSLAYLKGRGGCCKYQALPRVSEVTRGQSYFSRSTPKGISFLSMQFPTEKPECQGED